MTGEAVRLLLVDDDEDDYLIVRDMLASQSRVRFEVDWRGSYNDARATIHERRHDAYLIDYRLGSATGLDLIRDGFAGAPRAPVILLTGHDEYEIDLEASVLGVTDYLTKQALTADGLERAIRYAISHHKALTDLARSEERYALAARAASDGIWDWDVLQDRLYLSPRWHTILGHPEASEDASPDKWLARVHDDDRRRVQAAVDSHLAGQTPHLQVEHRIRHSDGSWRWVLNRGLAVRDQQGRPTRMAGSMADITARRTAEEQIQHDALHDPLTGLTNRALLSDRISQLLKRPFSPASRCAVIAIDLDRFKVVNDSLSHAVGDQLLASFAQRLLAVVTPGDTVARIGGDEFMVVLDAVSPQSAMAVAEDIQRSLLEPFRVGNHSLVMTASIGISLSDHGAATPMMLRDAHIAMHDVKRHGGGTSAMFDRRMHQSAVDRLTHEPRLREALEQGLIDVHYQPIVDLAKGTISGLEALARWPARWPPVSPVEFVPIAEESGLIRELGLHVLRTSLRAFAAWRRSGLVAEDTHLSVNISKRQLDDPRLPEQILGAIADAGLPADVLRLEITETTLTQELERMQRILAEVCATGVGVHLDDFGTGYSSLSALLQFPVTALKIDRSFVTSLIGHNSDSDAIVRSTIALAHNLDLHAIAEGIEHDGELDRLRSLGCEHGQGYLFSKPVSAQDIRKLLASWSPDHITALGSHAVDIGGAQPARPQP